MRNALLPKIIGVMAVMCALLGAQGPASASTNQEFCENGWAQSSASDYCPNATIGWTQQASLSCTVHVTCAVDVTVDGTSQRLSATISGDSTAPEALRLCIRRTVDDSDWELLLAGLCGSTTDAATAVAEGLSTQ